MQSQRTERPTCVVWLKEESLQSLNRDMNHIWCVIVALVLVFGTILTGFFCFQASTVAWMKSHCPRHNVTGPF